MKRFVILLERVEVVVEAESKVDAADKAGVLLGECDWVEDWDFADGGIEELED